jgi:heme exporter protein C
MIYQKWWKILGVVLLLYTFTAGMLVPLKPGIVDVTPRNGRTGETLQLAVTGYNTFYDRASAEAPVRAWLKLDEEHLLSAQTVTVEDDRRIQLSFNIPPTLPSPSKVEYFSLIVDDAIDGAHVLPSAVSITQDSIVPATAQAPWPNASLQDLHEKKGITFPFRNILAETIRNTYFHVPLWFAMIFIFLGAVVSSVRYLRGSNIQDDMRAAAFTQIGILFGLLGLVTGAIWAKNTWGAYWSGDIKQNMTAIALLIYLAYFVLRNAFDDPDQKARVAAAYNLFAFAAMIPLIYVIPRMYDSLHPGNGGNPALGGEDLDNTMRMIFYPAIIGWTLLGYWITSILYRANRLKERLLMAEAEE